jgi:hypothetical protein
MQTPEKQPFVVTLSGSRPPHDVAAELKKQGFDVGEVLEAIGVVTGHAPAASLDAMRKLSGVADISKDHPVDIGPPGAPVS